MFVTMIDNRVFVRLSRRNPRELEDILEGRDARHMCLVRKHASGVALVVQVDEDADHYDGRDPGPGLDSGA
jgi:hypothetical protein